MIFCKQYSMFSLLSFQLSRWNEKWKEFRFNEIRFLIELSTNFMLEIASSHYIEMTSYSCSKLFFEWFPNIFQRVVKYHTLNADRISTLLKIFSFGRKEKLRKTSWSTQDLIWLLYKGIEFLIWFCFHSSVKHLPSLYFVLYTAW